MSYIHHNPIHVCVQVFFPHPFFATQEFPCENLRYTTSGEFMMRKLAELRSFQAREEVDLDGLLKHFMTPPSQEKKAGGKDDGFFQQKHDLEQKMHC